MNCLADIRYTGLLNKKHQYRSLSNNHLTEEVFVMSDTAVKYTQAEMADMTGFSLEDYTMYEEGGADLPFSFIHKCASVFDVEIMELLEGRTPLLTGYTLTRAGGGQLTSVEPGVLIKNIAPLFKDRIADPYFVVYNIAPLFKDRIADPYFVVYNYNEEQQHTPIEQVTHPGQEFDYVLEGSMKIRIKDNEEVLHAGDSIFYNSSNPHARDHRRGRSGCPLPRARTAGGRRGCCLGEGSSQIKRRS